MVDYTQFKEALIRGGPDGLSEEDILKAREILDKFADILFAVWLEELEKRDTV